MMWSGFARRRQAHAASRRPLVAWKAAFLVVSLALGTSSAPAQQTPVATSDSANGPLSLVLNIPAFRLDVLRDGSVVHTYTVAVGMRRYPTPTGDFLISTMVWNPWWYPPDTPWAAKDSVTPPGPANPMGKAKLALGSVYFLHGTPAVSSLGKAASHGCIRMHNDDVVELASLAEQYHGGSPADTARQSTRWDWSRTRAVRLAVPVPVRIVYELAEVRDSLLIVHPDVYRRAREGRMPHAMDALQRAGIDSSSVSRDVLERLLAQHGAKPARIPLRELLRTRSHFVLRHSTALLTPPPVTTSGVSRGGSPCRMPQ